MKFLNTLLIVAMTTLTLQACATTANDDARRASPPPGSHSPFAGDQGRDINEVTRDQPEPAPEAPADEEPLDEQIER